jgi:hypothetical protein
MADMTATPIRSMSGGSILPNDNWQFYRQSRTNLATTVPWPKTAAIRFRGDPAVAVIRITNQTAVSAARMASWRVPTKPYRPPVVPAP